MRAALLHPRSVLGIAGLAVRTAVRSRFLLCLTLLLLVAVLALPFLIKGDGTAAGRVKVLLHYTLGFTALILAATSLWVSCGAISQQVESRQIQVLAVKPVRRWEIWLGNWLGLLAVNALLLALAAGLVAAFVHRTVWSSRTGARDRQALLDEVLVARLPVLPVEEPLDEAVSRRLTEWSDEGRIPAGVPQATVLSVIRRTIEAERSTVPAGHRKEWIFHMPPACRTESFAVRFQLSASFRDRLPVTGDWTVERAGIPGAFCFRTENRLNGYHRFVVPPASTPPGAPRGPGRSAFSAADPRVVVRFENAPRPTSNTAVFDPSGNIELLVPRGGFAGNLLRAVLVLYAQLAVLVAVGLTAGALFSFPVATFVAAAVVLIAVLGHSFTSAAASEAAHREEIEAPAAPSPALSFAQHTLENADAVVRPLLDTDPLNLLSDGILVPWRSVGLTVGLRAALYAAVAGAVAGWCLKRRELALPS
jgi:hypothetical protein